MSGSRFLTRITIRFFNDLGYDFRVVMSFRAIQLLRWLLSCDIIGVQECQLFVPNPI